VKYEDEDPALKTAAFLQEMMKKASAKPSNPTQNSQQYPQNFNVNINSGPNTNDSAVPQNQTDSLKVPESPPPRKMSIAELKDKLNLMKNKTELFLQAEKFKKGIINPKAFSNSTNSNQNTDLTNTEKIKTEEEIAQENRNRENVIAALKARKAMDDEEEERLQQTMLQLLLEQQAAEEEAKKKAELEKQMAEKAKEEEESESEIIFDEDEDIVGRMMVSSEEASNMANKIKRQLDDPKVLEMLALKFGKDDDFTNILLQRSAAENESLKACTNLLGNFFEPNLFPDFKKPCLNLPKFTPNVDLATAKAKIYNSNNQNNDQDDDEVMETSTSPNAAQQNANNAKNNVNSKNEANKKKKSLVPKKFEESTKIGTKSIAEFFNTQALAAMINSNINIELDEKAIKDLEASPMGSAERFAWLRAKLNAYAKDVLKRKMELGLLTPDQENATFGQKIQVLHVKPEALDLVEKGLPHIKSCVTSGQNSSQSNTRPINMTKTSQGFYDTRRSKRKYRVDLDLLNKRKNMDQIEILERRYHILWKKPDAGNSIINTRSASVCNSKLNK